MSTETPASMQERDEIPTMLVCTSCEVTWFGRPATPCWLCEREGTVVRTERLVLD